MHADLTALLARMLGSADDRPGLPIVDLSSWLDDHADPIARVSAAFLMAAAGSGRHAERAATILETASGAAADLAAFYRNGLQRIEAELERVAEARPDVATRIAGATAAIDDAATPAQVRDAIRAAFLPQAIGLPETADERITELRDRRSVTITALAAEPLSDPAREVLFTSNVLLTVPAAGTDFAALAYRKEVRDAIEAAAAEPQRRFYDHPIQIGVEPEANELLYGLAGLDRAMAAEPGTGRVTCLLSVSVTHDGLAAAAEPYVEAELERAGGLEHVDVVVITEDDANRLVDEVFGPIITRGADADPTAEGKRVARLRGVYGTNGAYGRHYSLLKAIAALWHVAIDPGVRATFKIDLDQVFPQDVLLEETGTTALGHLATPLWGAVGTDTEGREVELGMIAGALVNEKDIGRGLFTPDVELPERPPAFDEHVFWSQLPQAVSTRAEMMTRYDDGGPFDGTSRALERIHVTGGTNGIRVDALRRYRPFTPTWVGRAEDQSYILSAIGRSGPRLAYAHAAGLMMRHDKEAFAGPAIESARIDKLIGDDVRILVFSSYADVVADSAAELDRAGIERLLDPFTGAFVSAIPETLVLLRMALRTLRMIDAGDTEDAWRYAIGGAARVAEALDADGDARAVATRIADERGAWDDHYDALDTLEAGIAAGDDTMLELRERARAIIDAASIRR